MVDFDKVKEGVFLPTIAAIGFLIISLGISFAFGFVKGTQSQVSTMDVISLAYMCVNYVVYLIIFAYAGYRTAKAGGNLIESGCAGAVSSAITGIISVILSAVLMLVLGATALSGIDQGPSTLGFGAAMGVMVLVCGIGAVIIGAIINFGVGAAGGFLAGARK